MNGENESFVVKGRLAVITRDRHYPQIAGWCIADGSKTENEGRHYLDDDADWLWCKPTYWPSLAIAEAFIRQHADQPAARYESPLIAGIDGEGDPAAAEGAEVEPGRDFFKLCYKLEEAVKRNAQLRIELEKALQDRQTLKQRVDGVYGALADAATVPAITDDPAESVRLLIAERDSAIARTEQAERERDELKRMFVSRSDES